jgi:hypothetical protein
MNSLNSMYAMKKTIQQIIIGDSSGNLPVKGASLRLWLDASDPNATGTPPLVHSCHGNQLILIINHVLYLVEDPCLVDLLDNLSILPI